jgi:hypothetical protein
MGVNTGRSRSGTSSRHGARNYYGVIEQSLRAGCVPAKASLSRLSKTGVELLRRNRARTVPVPFPERSERRISTTAERRLSQAA